LVGVRERMLVIRKEMLIVVVMAMVGMVKGGLVLVIEVKMLKKMMGLVKVILVKIMAVLITLTLG
jgi:hypothetical protein